MRLIILTSTYAPKIGGAETYASNLARGLASLGHEISIITDMTTLATGEAEISKVDVRRLHTYRKAFDAPDRILWEEMIFGLRPEIADIMNDVAPHAIVSNSLDLCVIAKIASIAADVPWIATFHEQAPEREPLGPATLEMCYNLLQPDAVIAGSTFYLRRAQQYAPRKAHLIYHGIDTDQFSPSKVRPHIHQRYGLEVNSQLVVSLGRFKARKGFLDLIEGFALLPERRQPVALVIAGSLNSASESYFSELRSTVQLKGLGERVRFDDALSHESAPSLLCASDVIVQASHEEGLGLALMEAMACGRPVIATRIAGHCEVADADTAVLIDAHSPAQIAVALSDLLDDPTRRSELGVRARQRILEHFSLGTMAAATATLVQSLIDRRASHAIR